MSIRATVLVLAALALVLLGVRAFSPSGSRAAAFGRGPAIVLVRGFGSDTVGWLPTARILARRHRVVFVDVPGHGASDLRGSSSLARATRAVDAALARTSREPVVLVGHSLDGLVAAAEACAHPGRVRALVLIETSLRLASATDLPARVARLQCPLLVVLAPRSWPKGEPWVETAAELGFGAVPRVRAVRVDSCGHYVMRDRPDELARLIDRFADSPGGAPVVLAITLR